MQAVSNAYKQEMKKQYRDHSYMRVSIGLINQEAQASAYIPDQEKYAYYSNLTWPLNNYEVSELYETCDQDYSTVDGSMYFLPRERQDAVLNQGIITDDLLGEVEICFPVQHDIKGLTVEFGKAYPVDFSIVSDEHTVEITGNDTGHFVTEEIFPGATFLRFVPKDMVNGQSRLRIHRITMGIGIYFDNQKILSATKKERISPVMEDLPSIDLNITIDNKNRAYDIENEESTVNFLENGQEINVIYGQELDDGNVEWMPGTTVYLREWSADDEEMSFTATDRFDGMDGTYRRGKYYPDGISLYDLAVDVFGDAGIDSRTYWLDNYLKDVMVYNPMPVVSHKEALQLIANAGRCILYQDRNGNIFMKSSFIPDMQASSANETYFSNTASVLDATEKSTYATPEKDHTEASAVQFFLPYQDKNYLDVGYVSEAVADEDGAFTEDPLVTIVLEARYKCFGLTLEFGGNHPSGMVFRSYLGEELVEEYKISSLSEVTVVNHEFPEFDKLQLEFLKGVSFNRVNLKQITFGDSTDYELSYGKELTKTPKGTQLSRVRELQMTRTIYTSGTEKRQLVREAVPADETRHTFYLNAAAYDYEIDAAGGTNVQIIDSSAYYVTVEVDGGADTEVTINGYEYNVTQALVTRQLNPTGTVETWENPLVSTSNHAADLAEWIGDYLRSDREYNLEYRGEPRIDANDIAFLENKYVQDLLLRIYEHTLKFNGALSGTIKARRDMSNVATAKNRLAGQ